MNRIVITPFGRRFGAKPSGLALSSRRSEAREIDQVESFFWPERKTLIRR
jgi:hypothetical protein